MRIPEIRFYKVGSDPECVFGRVADTDYGVVPASQILGKNKAKALRSFIGTDARPVLAELRPGANRNIRAHLHTLAYGLDQIVTHLAAQYTDLVVLALPELHGEPLGGHIHASMWIRDPLYEGLARAGGTLAPNGSFLEYNDGWFTDVRALADLAPDAYTPQTWGHVMDWLLQPFERWVQPWIRREKRNVTYGHNADTVRLGPSKPPGGSYIGPHGAYVHWEYRVPSTWLHTPVLAYAYLALAKLIILNHQAVLLRANRGTHAEPALSTGATPSSTYHHFIDYSRAQNEDAHRLFLQRLEELLTSKHCRRTPDLRDLERAVETCEKHRARWFAHPQPIEIDAWRRLL